MVVIRAAVWYNKGVKIKAYQGFWDFSRGFSAVPPVPLLRHIALEWGNTWEFLLLGEIKHENTIWF